MLQNQSQGQPPDFTSKTRTTEINHRPVGQSKLKKPWIVTSILLVLSFLTVSQVSSANGANPYNPWNFLATPSLSPTGSAKPTQTATVTVKPTRTPTVTATLAPTATPEMSVKVHVSYASLRTGPGTNYDRIRDLSFGEPVQVLGKLSDRSWIYVKTSDNKSGWLPTTWVKVASNSVDLYTIQTPPPPSDKIIKMLGTYNLHNGPLVDFSIVTNLKYGDQLTLLGWLRDRTWLYAKTLDGKVGWVKTTWVDLAGVNLVSDYYPVQTPPPTETSTPVILEGVEGHWIDIDLSEQKLYAYEGTQRVASFLVSTGIDQYPTEVGQYKIYVKYLYSDMHGNDYYLPDVPYSMYYSGDFSIHGTYWHHNFGHPMSHGCVNMDIKDAEWVYNWADVGTIVNVHR